MSTASRNLPVLANIIAQTDTHPIASQDSERPAYNANAAAMQSQGGGDLQPLKKSQTS